jgi:hypothetical protein
MKISWYSYSPSLGAPMKPRWAKPIQVMVILVLPVLLLGGMATFSRVQAAASTPTVFVPSVTSTLSGPMVTVRADADVTQINVRSGPGTEYERVGVLLASQSAPAKGRSEGGKWIMIEYPGVPSGTGWVYSSYVNVAIDQLSVVEPPPTPTPAVTMTIDPTLAAKFVVTSAATRLPTYTPPPALVIPTFSAQRSTSGQGIPMGMVIIGLAAVGIFIGLFTLAQNR